jgi:hypothetical protein
MSCRRGGGSGHRWGVATRDRVGGLRYANLPYLPARWRITMNGNRYYGVQVESAKYGVGFGSALAMAISYTNNHSILWAIIHGILGWLYVIYVALFG